MKVILCLECSNLLTYVHEFSLWCVYLKLVITLESTLAVVLMHTDILIVECNNYYCLLIIYVVSTNCMHTSSKSIKHTQIYNLLAIFNAKLTLKLENH